jgi:hypothetical protein
MGALRPPDPKATLAIFGIDLETELGDGPLTAEQAKAKLADIKARAKKRYRELALEHHPDKSGDDTEMKRINDAYDWVQRLAVTTRQRPKPVVRATGGVTVYVVRTGTMWATNTSTTTTTGEW